MQGWKVDTVRAMIHNRHSQVRGLGVLATTTLVLLLSSATTAVAQDWMATGTYTGDGNMNHVITGIGFQPDLVIIKDQGSNEAIITTSAMPLGRAKQMDANNPVTSGMILSLNSDGFTLGPSFNTNQNGHAYHWVAMRALPDVMEVGEYVGDGSGSRNLTVGLDAGAAMIMPASSYKSVFHSQVMNDDESYPLDGSGVINGAIDYLFGTYIGLGDHDTVNKSGDSYYYVAWETENGRVRENFYGGTGSEGMSLLDFDIDHQFLMIQSASGLQTVQRMTSLTGDNSLLFTPTSAQSNLIQDLFPTGFELGDDAKVNQSGTIYYYWVFGNPLDTADLQINTSVDNPTPHEGDEIHVAAGITNLGPSGTTGVSVYELLPVGLSLITVNISKGSYDTATGIWNVGALTNGENATLVLGAVVDSGTAGSLITNTATIAISDLSDLNNGNNTSSVDINVLDSQQVDLDLTLTLDQSLPAEGETVNYQLTVWNLGPDDATGVQIDDALPAGLTFSSASPDHGIYDSGTGIWTIGGLSAGESATLDLSVTVDAGTAGNTITNTAFVSAADQTDPEAANDHADVDLTVTGAPLADLAVTLTLDDDTPQEGDTVTYDLTVTNNGPDTATGIQISDLLPSGLTLAQATASKGTYDSGTGVWTVGNLIDGDGATLILQATVDAGTIGDVITNTAAVSAADQSDPTGDNDSASQTLVVTGSDLVLAMTLDDNTPGEGQDILYFLTVTNDGPHPATGIQVTDLLPTGLVLNNVNPDQGTYDGGTGVWDVGDLADGATAQLPLVATTELGTAGMGIVNTGSITAVDQVDPDTGNNTVSLGLTVQPVDLSLTKNVDDTTPREGDTVTFTVIVTNSGDADATGIMVADPLPAGLTYSIPTLTQGTFDPGAGVWTVGTVPGGATATMLLDGEVDAGTTGQTITNSVSISALDQTDLDNTDNSASVNMTITNAPITDLGLVLTLDNPTPGEGAPVDFQLTVTNNGPTPATSILVTDLIPAGLTFSDATTTSGTYDDGTGIWDIGDLAVGISVELALTATTDLGTAGLTFVNSAAITDVDQDDTQSDNDSGSVQLTVQGLDLQLAAEVDNPTPMGGDVVNFTITLSNLASVLATGINVQTALPDGTTLLAATADQGTFDQATGTWQVGSLAGSGVVALVLQTRVDAIFASEPLDQTAAITAVDQTDTQSTNNTAAAIIIVAGIDLELVKTVDVATPREGDTVQYTITVTNTGTGDATGVQITDILPASVDFTSGTATRGTYAPDTGIWDIDDLEASTEAVLTISCTVADGAGGRQVTNFAAVTASDQADAVTGNNSDTTTFNVIANLQAGTIQYWTGSGTTALMWPGTTERAQILALTLTNKGAVVDIVTALTLTNLAAGPGTRDQLDSQWQELTLGYTRRGGAVVAEQPVSGAFSNGRIIFDNLGWNIAPGDTLDILVQGAPSLAAPDNSRLRLGLADPRDVAVTQEISASGPWPLTDGSIIVVDGFTAAQATVIPVPSVLFPVGSANNLALAVDLPGNGYLGDTLYGLGIVNYGTAQPQQDISRMRAWADRGDGTFDAGTDILLGSLAFSGELWQISGLNTIVPPTGKRIFITVDIAETARPTTEIRLGLPAGAGTAVEMFSGNDGPLDAPLDNPGTQGINVTDRIILTADYVHSGSIRPGTRDLTLLQFVLTNTYAEDQPLQGLAVTNTAAGPGEQARLDHLCRQVILRLDGNDNGILDDLGTDPQLASGTYDGGRIVFTGLNQVLAVDAGVRLFVTADLDLLGVADGDAISAQVNDVYDVDIPGATLVASWPLNSGAEWIVDGLVADQIGTGAVRTMTLGPDDGPVLAMDLTLPGNGGLGDQLQGITFINQGTADATDVTVAQLWADGGDGTFDGGVGDDEAIGRLNLDSDTWASTVLERSLPAEGLRLFVSLDVSSTPHDSVTVQLMVPVNGILLASSNDGPLDDAVPAGGTLTISTSPLRSTVSFDSQASNVGQTGTVTMTVTNAGAEVVTGIVPVLQVDGGGGSVDLRDPTPSVLADLAPGQWQEITWSYTGTGAGTVILTGNASGTVSSSQVRRSIQTPTAPHRIFNPVDHLELYPTVNLPFSINRGQGGLVPLTLTFMNPGDADVADAQLTGLSLRFMETPTGPDIIPSDLIDRVTISEGTEIYLDRNDPPDSGSRLDLVFDRAVRITSEEPVTLGVKFDLDLNSTAPSFLISITDASWFVGNDAVDMRSVPVQLGEGLFPVQTGQATLVTPATGLDVAIPSGEETLATPGQMDVPLLGVHLANSGNDNNSSTIEVGRMTFILRDGTGAAVSHPDSLLDRVVLHSMFLDYYSGPAVVTDDSLLTLLLSPPVTVPGGGTLNLLLQADLAERMPLGPLTPSLVGPGGIDARDGNMNNPVPVTLVTAPSGPPVVILAPATTVVVSGHGQLPGSLARGARDAMALVLTLANTNPTGSTTIACDGLMLKFLGADHGALDPDLYLDRIRIRCGDTYPGFVIEPEAGDGIVTVPVDAQILAPSGPEIILEVLLDLKSDAPAGALEIVVDNTGILAHDVVTDLPVASVRPDGGLPYLSSGTTWIVQPADEMQVAFQDLMPPLLAPENGFTPVMDFDLANPAPTGHGAIDLVTLTLGQAAGPLKLAPPHLGSLVAAVRLRSEKNILVTADLEPTADTAVLTLDQPLTLAAGQSQQVIVEITIREGSPAGSLQLAVQTDGIDAVQEGSTGSPVHLSPVAGTSFPFVTQVGNLGARDFDSSFINFPNPFAAGRKTTTFSYVLPAEAHISLRILTPHGEVVTTLLQDEPRTAGLHQEDIWQGLNGRGHAVHNGVYLAELKVRYVDGSSAKALRKVGVVR